LAGDCIDEDDTAEGAVPCVGPNGEVYVAWSNRHKIWFDRSLDGGESWLDADVEVAEQPGGWDYKIPGVWRCNGLPVSACDTSGGTHHGTVYVNWTDQRNGTNDTDVWLSKSTDGGATWTSPQRVNDDAPGHHQFFTWMTIDQTNGWLWFVFYDRRHYNDERTDVYMALSKDGGATVINFKVSETPFIPSEDFFMGDYNNITAHENVVRPIWTRMDNGALSVWTALVNPDLVQTLDSPTVIEPLFTLENPAPNPSTDLAGFSFKLKKRALVNLSVVDLQGVVRAQPIREEWRDTGKHLERVYLNQLGLESGVYFFILQVDGQFARKKVLLVRGKT
jgi:hypothetical protein